jgi:uncharacterized repeat protein (TIGR01451 family)
MRPRFVLPLALLAAVSATPASALTLEREVRLDANRLQATSRDGVVSLVARGGTHEFTPGRPDLPWLSERIDLPAGMKLVAVEVVGVRTELLMDQVRVATAPAAIPGAGPEERTAADPAIYGSDRFQPEVLVLPGTQGSLRGRNVAYLRVAPARWNPATGRLERIISMKLELTLAEGAAPAVVRERIVREWEDELPSGVPSRALVSLGSSAAAGAGGTKPKAEPFKPLQVPSVLGSPVEYVIVTNDAMAPVFQQLADWKTQSGVPAVVRTTSFIRAQYPYGVDDAERIRLFLRDAYARWGTKWVLLGGDTDVIPERLALNVNFYQVEHIAADLYYSCLDGNWNANGNHEYGQGYEDEFITGDGADILPEVYVGRSPVSTPGEAQTFVNKTLAYEKNPVAGYTDDWLMFAEVLFPQPYNGGPIDMDGAPFVEDILPLAANNPDIQIERYYENHTEPSYVPGALPESKAAVLAELNLGPSLALHVGHGYRNSMSVGDASIVNADASALTNGNKTFNLYAIDCTSAAIDFPCIAEAFIKNPNGGAVTVIGSTRFDFPTAGRAYQQEYFRLFFEDSVSAVGELQARQKLPFTAFAFYDGLNRWTQLTLLLLGDPELRMYNGNWRTLAASGLTGFVLGDSLANVHVTTGGQPLMNARVTLYKAGDEFRTGLTDSNGDVQLPFRPDSSGSFTLTVTAYNSKPFQAALNVTAAAAAQVSEAAVSVDDDNAGGTSGNGDGFADAGETVDLRIALRNRGGASTNGDVQGTLTTADAFVTVTQPDGFWFFLAAGATGNPVVPFRLSIPPNVPDQREVPFSLVLWDGNRSWRENVQLTVRAPEPVHAGHTITESPGNNDGKPTPGETATYTMKVRNNGSGIAKGVTAKLRALNGLATVTDSTSSLGDIASGVIGTGDPFVFTVNGVGALFQVEIRDAMQVRLLQTVDLTFPIAPSNLAALGEADAVKLTWEYNADLTLPGGTSTSGTATCDFSGASSGIKSLLTTLRPGDKVVDAAGFYPANAVVVSYNSGTFVLTLSGNAFASSAAGEVTLIVRPNDLAGYNIYRAPAIGGPYTKVNVLPTDRTSYYHDEQLTPLTKYFYRCTAVDSSGNESGFLAAVGVSTNPPLHAIYPVPTGGTTPTSVAVDFPYSTSMGTVVAGSEVLYVLNADGSAPLDSDGQGSTLGDFSQRGSYFAAGPSMSVLGPGEAMSFIAPSWDSMAVYVWDRDGDLRPGFPVYTNDAIWGSATVCDLDNDGHMEIAFPNNGNRFHVMRENGLEWMDGDLNPATRGVFKLFLGGGNIGTAAAADIDQDGDTELIYGSLDGRLYVWRADGSNLPGFPFVTTGAINSSAAVGFLDGPGDTSPEIVFTSLSDSLYVLNANGLRRPGFPIWTRTAGSSRSPSPALADMNNDGFLDIVHQSTNGGVYVFTRTGGLVFPWSNVRYTTLTSAASESSPVVADINGDGWNDIVCGGEEGQLTALSGSGATVLPGFPIQLSGEVRGTPALADIDKDGKTEIIFAGWDKNIYIWDYDFTFQPSGVAPWPQFHHDSRRTGFASTPLFVDVPGDPGSAPVARLEFAPPSPNPTRFAPNGTKFEFAIPATLAGGNYEIAVFDLSGRRVKLVDSGQAKAGRYSVRWDLRDASGQPVEGGVYFARFALGGSRITHKLVVLQ